MPAAERRALLTAFEQARIQLTDESRLVVHAIEPLTSSELPPHVRTGRSMPSVLRVRRLGFSQPGPFAWALDVTVELVAWMLVTPPPPGTELDVVVPAASYGAAPRLARPHGLIDTRHVAIIARERGVSPARRAQVQPWAKALVHAMKPRWSPDGAACACC
ncbi:hypothetical protein J7E70_16365 [Variovorax paradoxus]|nr:hypothetical protein [Variovorax paradoxus]MBT2302039.1 hypothetical protein [Variovorax paradoxus]MBT2323681.1 hypothetical protein [Variovorax paradoxus]